MFSLAYSEFEMLLGHPDVQGGLESGMELGRHLRAQVWSESWQTLWPETEVAFPSSHSGCGLQSLSQMAAIEHFVPRPRVSLRPLFGLSGSLVPDGSLQTDSPKEVPRMSPPVAQGASHLPGPCRAAHKAKVQVDPLF